MEVDDDLQTHQLPHVIPRETRPPTAELETVEVVEVMMVGPLMAEETSTLEEMTQIIQITVVPYIKVTPCHLRIEPGCILLAYVLLLNTTTLKCMTDYSACAKNTSPFDSRFLKGQKFAGPTLIL